MLLQKRGRGALGVVPLLLEPQPSLGFMPSNSHEQSVRLARLF